jgi:hypothetical protein
MQNIFIQNRLAVVKTDYQLHISLLQLASRVVRCAEFNSDAVDFKDDCTCQAVRQLAWQFFDQQSQYYMVQGIADLLLRILVDEYTNFYIHCCDNLKSLGVISGFYQVNTI